MTDQSIARRPPAALTWLIAILGVAALIVAVIYFVSSADALPAFFPGHETDSTHHHTTHGIAALVLGLVLLIGAWMTSGIGRSAASAD